MRSVMRDTELEKDCQPPGDAQRLVGRPESRSATVVLPGWLDSATVLDDQPSSV